MSSLDNEDLELAHDELCDKCAQATLNSSDGGKLPCHRHKLLFMQRTYPVITHNLDDGDWTCTWVDSYRVQMMIEAILVEFAESEQNPEEFMKYLDPKVVQMTKAEYEEIPEL